MNSSPAETALAWLVPNCPNFYFLPSMHYDRLFCYWESANSPKDSPAYWSGRGYPVVPLHPCAEEHATHWLVNGSYGVFDRESADAARSLGKAVVPVAPKEAEPSVTPEEPEAPAIPEANGERGAFEQAAREQGHLDLKRHPDGAYRNVYLEAAWCGWQQRAAQGIPHGMALVPVEPTPAMRHAGWAASDAAQGCFNHEHGDLCPHCGDGFGQPDGCGSVAVASYRAMLKAAPEAGSGALPEDFVTSVRKLVMLARTSGGTAGRDDALCQALDSVEDQLSAFGASH